MNAKTLGAASVFALAAALAGSAMPAAYGSTDRAVSNHAATCDGLTCYNKDPKMYGCAADAVNVGPPAGNSSEQAYLRYSAHCHAAWVKIFGGPGTPGYVKTTQGRQALVDIRTGHEAYSVMVPRILPNEKAQACVIINSQTELKCTDFL